MANPIVLACGICGERNGNFAMDTLWAVAYCQRHTQYAGGNKIAECPNCQYRFNRGNAAWFFDKPDAERRCLCCGGSLDAYHVASGNATSRLASNFDRTQGCLELARLMNKGQLDENNSRTAQAILIKAVDTRLIGKFDVPAFVVETIAKVGGNEAREAFKRWSKFFSWQPGELKKAAAEHLKKLT